MAEILQIEGQRQTKYGLFFPYFNRILLNIFFNICNDFSKKHPLGGGLLYKDSVSQRAMLTKVWRTLKEGAPSMEK